MQQVLPVEGMMCGHCKAAVEKACLAVPGVTGARADLAEKKVTVTGEADKKTLAEAIRGAGFEVKD